MGIVTITYPISTSGATRLPVLVAVQSVFLSMHLFYMPFRLPAVNRAQFVALLGSIVIILAGNYVTIDTDKEKRLQGEDYNEPSRHSTLGTVLAIVTNIFVVLYLVYAALHPYHAQIHGFLNRVGICSHCQKKED